MTLDLPRRMLADRLALALVAASAVAVEATLGRYEGLPQGPGILAGFLLALWQWRLVRRRPRTVSLQAPGVPAPGTGIGPPASSAGPGARVLGSSVVLHWRDGAGEGTAWLTRADAPRETLRLARVCFRTRDPSPTDRS